MSSSPPKHSSSKKAKRGKGRIGRGLYAIFHVYRRRWFQVFAFGSALIVLMEVSYLLSVNPNLVPALIIYGAILVPMTMLVYLYERLTAWEVPMPVLLVVFLTTGALGIALASTLEGLLLPDSIFENFGVGLIEEIVKLIAPVFIFFFASRYRSEAAGVIVGFTSAMGFSALETAGYGFNAFLGNADGPNQETVASIFKSPWNLLNLELTEISRSVFDPVGHGVFTILICYVLFHERRRIGRFVLNGRVAGAFVLAVLLHAAMDTSLSVPSSAPGLAHVIGNLGFLVVTVLIFWLLVRIVHKTRKDMGVEQEDQEAGAVPSAGSGQ